MFKTRRIMLYKCLGVWLLLFVLFSCESSEFYSCSLVCGSGRGPDKALVFSFSRREISLGKDKQVSIFMEHTKTKKQRMVICKEPVSLQRFNVSTFIDSCYFSLGLPKDSPPILPFFDVRFYDVEAGQYLFTLKSAEETLSTFTYDVSYDYRFCSYCSNTSFYLNDDLQPKEEV